MKVICNREKRCPSPIDHGRGFVCVSALLDCGARVPHDDRDCEPCPFHPDAKCVPVEEERKVPRHHEDAPCEMKKSTVTDRIIDDLEALSGRTLAIANTVDELSVHLIGETGKSPEQEKDHDEPTDVFRAIEVEIGKITRNVNQTELDLRFLISRVTSERYSPVKKVNEATAR